LEQKVAERTEELAVTNKKREEKYYELKEAALHQRTVELAGTNASLKIEIIERKRAAEELREYMTELEQFNRLAVNRELRRIELKREVNRAYERLGEKPPYDLSFANEGITNEELETEGEKERII
jgi:hypothetical protein